MVQYEPNYINNCVITLIYNFKPKTGSALKKKPKKLIHFHQQVSQNHTSSPIGLFTHTSPFTGGSYANFPARIWKVWNERW